MPIPVNDKFVNAQAGDTGSVTGNNTDATFEVGELAGPIAAPGTIRFFDPNGLVGGQYVGRWVLHIPAFTAPGDGDINEVDIEVAIPGVPSGTYSTGIYIGNDNDGDPTRFTGGVEIDSDALPAWIPWSGTYTGGEPAVYLFDGEWEFFEAPFTITVDPASDPDWYRPSPGQPVFTSIVPTTGLAASSITITGTDLSAVTQLWLRHDGVNVYGNNSYWGMTSFTVVDNQTLTANIPAGVPDGSTHVFYDSPVRSHLYTGLTFEVLAPAAPGAPANDQFSNAQLITGDSGSVTGTNTDATVQGGEPPVTAGTSGQTASVWYRWTPSVSMTAVLRLDTFTGNGGANIIEVFTGSTLYTLTELPNGDSREILAGVEAGTEYHIRVRSTNGGINVGGFTLHWEEADIPANDHFADAEVILGASGSVPGTTKFTGNEPNEPVDVFWNQIPARSVWYTWTAPSTGRYTFDTGPPEGTRTESLDVFIGDSISTLTLLAYNNRVILDQSPEYQPDWSRVILGAKAGMTYYIRVSVPFASTSDAFSLYWYPTPARAVDPFDSPSAPIRVYSWAFANIAGDGVVVCELSPTDPDWRVVGFMEFDGEVEFHSSPHTGTAPLDTVNNRNVGMWSGGLVGGSKAYWHQFPGEHSYPDQEDIPRIAPTMLFDSADGMGVPGSLNNSGVLTYTAENRISSVVRTVVDSQIEYWVVDRNATTGAVVESKKIDVPLPYIDFGNSVSKMGISPEAVVFSRTQAATANLLTAADKWQVAESVGTWTAVSGITSLVRSSAGQMRIRVAPGSTTAVYDLPASYSVGSYYSAIGNLATWATTGVTGTVSVQMLGPSGPIGTATSPVAFGNNATGSRTVEAAVSGLATVGMRVTVQLNAPAGSFTDVFSLTSGSSPSLSLKAPTSLHKMDRATEVVTTLLSNMGASYPHWGDPVFTVENIRIRPNGQLAVHTKKAFFGESGHHFTVLTADGSTIVSEYSHPENDQRLYFGSYDPILDGWIVSYFGEPGTPYAGVDSAFIRAGMGFIDAATGAQHELPSLPQATYDTWEMDAFAAGAAPAPPCPDNTVWYDFTPSRSGEATFFIDADGLSMNLEAFTGNDLTSLVGPVASYNGGDPDSPMTFEVTGGTTYWIRAYNTVPGEEGPFTLSWALGWEIIEDFIPAPIGKKLGCSQHVAYIQLKCNGPRLCELNDISNLSYERRLDDISEAYVEIPISGDMDDPCCACLGAIEPWCHLLTIVREGDGVVWSGPVQKVVYGFDSVRIEAKDKLAWLQMRVNEIPIVFEDEPPTVPLTTVAKHICEVAMIDDDDSPCFLDCILDPQQGIPLKWRFPAFEGPTAYDDLEKLAGGGVDFTVVNQCLILTSEEALLPRAIGTLTDEMILGDLAVIKDGTLMGNRVFVRWDGDDDCAGKCAPHAALPCPFPHEDCCPCPGMREISEAERVCYGLIERLIPTDTALADSESAALVAQMYLDANKTSAVFIEFPSGTRLSPETPWLLNDMIPGQRVNVALNKLCLPIYQSFKLQQVSVQDGEGGEEIKIDLRSFDVDTGA